MKIRFKKMKNKNKYDKETKLYLLSELRMIIEYEYFV